MQVALRQTLDGEEIRWPSSTQSNRVAAALDTTTFDEEIATFTELK
jgi:hypothetical protein